ncbi:hypothetical protein WA026_018012 [Henosepilachna vigintioctopunctata]|uniref:PIPK domain-containing protein n=1 Tax=Henosepilachna vigintioctopunctata TaxID=420089 RepID=A0AAW1TV20_9CUCU
MATNSGQHLLGPQVSFVRQSTLSHLCDGNIVKRCMRGIQHAVGGLASKPERDLLMQDFMTVETTNFPSEGSNHTPAHHYSEFKFKNYAPIAFRYFRDLFGIQPDDFLMSMCDTPLRELSNPGASGSIFYLTSDDEFIIKTVQHKEGEFLQKLLAGYYMNLNQNPRTLLPKFFGLYCYQCNSKNIRMVVMNNLLPTSIHMHEKYDLKGSTYKRKASKAECQKRTPTYKDLDFMEHHPEGILMEADTYNALIKTIQRDCRVLESFKIMDYSLLLTVHNLDLAQKEKAERRSQMNLDDMPDEGALDEPSVAFIHGERAREKEDRMAVVALNRSKSINRQRLVAHSTAMESIQAESEPIDEDEGVPPGGIPARNSKGERLLLFIGIIDILQSYRLKKKLEHTWKSMIHDGDTVSVHRPSFYASRFLKFMAETVFKKFHHLSSIRPPRENRCRDLFAPTKKITTNIVSHSSVNLFHATSSACGRFCIVPVASPTDSSAPAKVSPPSHYPPIVTTSTPHTPLTSPPATSYPAILVGRPTVENKPKVPPPVPPRGTPKTKRGGIAGKGLHRRCFGHERHVSAPDVASGTASACSTESYSSSPKMSSMPKRGRIERLKVQLGADNAKTDYATYTASSKAKVFKDLFEARAKILGERYEENINENETGAVGTLNESTNRNADIVIARFVVAHVHTGIVQSCCSTPPPTFDEVLELRASEPLDTGTTPTRRHHHHHGSHGSYSVHQGHYHASVRNYRDDSISINDIKLESRAETKSSLSVESGSSSGAGHSSHSRGGLTWTPPASVEGSTPTWTEDEVTRELKNEMKN